MGCSQSACAAATAEVVDVCTRSQSCGGRPVDVALQSQSFGGDATALASPLKPAAGAARAGHGSRSQGDEADSDAQQAPRAQRNGGDEGGAEDPQAPGGMPTRFEVRVQRGRGDKVGAVLGDAGTGAVILSIKEGGIFDRWNAENPQNAMRQGFIIEKMNGAKGYWNIMQEIRKLGAWTITVSSRPPAEKGAGWFEKIAEVASSVENKGLAVRLQLQEPSSAAATQFCGLPRVTASDCSVDQCAICLDDVAPHETLVQLPCKHAFHHLCAARWLAQGAQRGSPKIPSCPLCCQKVVGTPEGGACCS